MYMENNGRLILASQSPARKQLVGCMTDEFDAIPARAEEVFDPALPIDAALLEVARHKALEIHQQHPARPVIAADTIIVFEGKIMGKPASLEEASRVLHALSGKGHEVKSAMVYIDRKGRIRQVADTAWVHFRKLSDQDIQEYVNRKTCLLRAGSYGIQEVDFVDHIEGSFDTVVGLPTEILREWLAEDGLLKNSAEGHG